MGSNKIVLALDPTAAQDVATKNYVDTTTTPNPLYVAVAGDTMTGDLRVDASIGINAGGRLRRRSSRRPGRGPTASDPAAISLTRPAGEARAAASSRTKQCGTATCWTDPAGSSRRCTNMMPRPARVWMSSLSVNGEKRSPTVSPTRLETARPAPNSTRITNDWRKPLHNPKRAKTIPTARITPSIQFIAYP